jgi:hypothetical protein
VFLRFLINESNRKKVRVLPKGSGAVWLAVATMPPIFSSVLEITFCNHSFHEKATRKTSRQIISARDQTAASLP